MQKELDKILEELMRLIFFLDRFICLIESL